MYKLIFIVITFLLVVILSADGKTFDINDYVIDLENNKIEHINEDSIFMHSYEDSLRLSITTELLEYESGVFPLFIEIDSMETILVDDNINIPKYIETETNKVLKYSNNPIKLGGKGTLRHKYLAVLESFPFVFKDDSLFFTPRIEYSFIDTFSFTKSKYSISEKIDMIIITKEEFVDVFEPFRIFKNKMGLNTKIKTIEEIYQEYEGETDVIKIRHYIQDIYNKNNLEYVVIGGNYSVIPVGYAKPLDGVEQVPTDAFYSNLDGEVDNNGNGIYFELFDYPDFYADVYVGRFPGSNQIELQSIIQKQINYYLGLVNQRSDFNTSLFLSGFNIFIPKDGEEACEKVKNEFPTYFKIETLYEESSPIFNQQTLINALNLGYNVYYHQSHGDYNKVGQNDNNWALWSDQFYNFTGTSGLYFVASCHPGDIGFSGLSQKAMINPNGGCVNYIGSSGNDYLGIGTGMHLIFFNNVLRGKCFGESLVYANLLSYGNLLGNAGGMYLNYSYNIQGDPSNKLFLRNPRNISILGIAQFKKGNGSVNGVFNVVPNETVEITLMADGEIITTTTTESQSFTLEYDNLFSDSVYVYYHSQECYLKEKGYQVYDNNDTEIEIANIAIDDDNSSDICESGEHFSMNFDINVSLNELNHDSLIVYLSENTDENFTFVSDSIKIAMPSLNNLTNLSVFDIVYDPLTKVKADSSLKVKLNFQIDGGALISQKEIYLPYADPVLKLQSVSFTQNNIFPTFINDSQGMINKAEVSLLEIIKESITEVKSTKILYDILGLTTVEDDTLYFQIDSTKTYKFQIMINDDYVYNTSEFTSSNISGSLKLYTDYSPGKVNLEWANDL
ncbi:MAG: C25 family cysteine peptidase, partial [Candidatus Delongbacteria bacterium]|nr:C25 family cysteine peptidase [Candidatus Delongbacteria bacterium]